MNRYLSNRDKEGGKSGWSRTVDDDGRAVTWLITRYVGQNIYAFNTTHSIKELQNSGWRSGALGILRAKRALREFIEWRQNIETKQLPQTGNHE